MGVVYKFKKDIIDFVLHQKRIDNALSCRQLAVLTSERFKIQVSKSSVNAIIKNAHLSSSVGRPMGFASGPRKFQIPPRKKQQLLEEIHKVGVEKKIKPVADVPSAPSQQRKPVAPKPPAFAQEDFLRQVQSLREARARNAGKMYEGMGCVFLKAAQWMACRTSVLGSLLRKYAQGPLPPDFDALCDGLACLSVAVADLPDKSSLLTDKIGQCPSHGIWALNTLGNGLQAAPDMNMNWINTIPGSLNLFLEYEKEKKQIFIEARQFKIYLEDGSQLITDARLSRPWAGQVPRECSACLEQAMAMLSHRLISNNQPVIFLSSAGRPPAFAASLAGGGLPAGGGRRQFDWGILDLVTAFEGLEGKRMHRVEVLDVSGEWLAGFSSLPSKRRIFMLGVWPGQAEFELLAKDIKTAEPVYHEQLDRVMYCGDRPTGLFQKELRDIGPLRAVAVSTIREGPAEMVIVTNDAHKPSREVVSAFLERWPVLDKGPMGKILAFPAAPDRNRTAPQSRERDVLWKQAGLPVPHSGTYSAGQAPSKAELSTGQAGRDIGWLFRDFGEELHQYCQEHFFCGEPAGNNLTSFISMYYGLSGFCVPQDKTFRVSLRRQDTPGVAEGALRMAVDRVNESAIDDPLGRRLFIAIE